jgi:hypothetical protein
MSRVSKPRPRRRPPCQTFNRLPRPLPFISASEARPGQIPCGIWIFLYIEKAQELRRGASERQWIEARSSNQLSMNLNTPAAAMVPLTQWGSRGWSARDRSSHARDCVRFETQLLMGAVERWDGRRLLNAVSIFEATMDRRKRNGPICYACGGMKHRRRPDGTRWCPRFGCLPSGQHLDSTGRPVTMADRIATAERLASLRKELEVMRAEKLSQAGADHVPILGWRERLRRYYHSRRGRWLALLFDRVRSWLGSDVLHAGEI